ncbi:MAG: hypothetical protein ABIZ64_06095 [Casimicrobium sp.]
MDGLIALRFDRNAYFSAYQSLLTVSMQEQPVGVVAYIGIASRCTCNEERRLRYVNTGCLVVDDNYLGRLTTTMLAG